MFTSGQVATMLHVPPSTLRRYVARYGFASDVAFYLVLGFAGVVGGALYWIAMESAVSTAIQHRERILHDLSNAGGPIVSD